MPVDEAPDDEGEGAPRPSYNFAPGYHGIVYRADVPDWGAGPRREAKAKGAAGKRSEKGEAGATTTATPAESTAEASDAANPANSLDPEQEHDVDDDTGASGGHDDGAVHYKLQTMKWGLIPFWTKRNPDYGSMLKTINCRDDSLAQGAGGMWNTMKARKRCIVVAQGFYEWLKKDGSKDKVPHFIKRKDGALMCCAGLWDCVQYESESLSQHTPAFNKKMGEDYTGMIYRLTEGVLLPAQTRTRSSTRIRSSRRTLTSSSGSSMTACR